MSLYNTARWDPKITTPPGLYVFALAYARLVSYAKEVLPLLWVELTRADGAVHEPCTAGVLRQVNWGFSLGTLAVMRALLARHMVRKTNVSLASQILLPKCETPPILWGASRYT